MNILYIGNKLSGENRTATTIDTLGPQLKSLGYNVKYASSVQNKALRFLDMIFSVFWNSKWVDVVLIDTYSTQNFWYAIAVGMICRVFKIAYIPILHGGNLPARLKKNPEMFSTFLKHARYIVCPSAYLEHAFAKAGFSNILVIPNSIKGEDYPFNKRVNVTPKILWVRSLAEIYNPKMALEALKLLSVKYPNASLTMVGPDKENLKPTLLEYAKDNNLDVKFTGLLTKSDWIELSKDHDIFINTTHYDNMPVSIIEAMALGIPVISTNVGGIPYLIRHQVNGLLVQDDDAVQMASSIEEILNNPEKVEALTQKARSTASKYFWQQVKEQWKGILS